MVNVAIRLPTNALMTFAHHRSIIALLLLASANDASGNAKLLTDSDQIRVLQDVAIGFEDFRVQAGVAVVLLGDLAQRLALLNDVPLGCVPLVGSATLLRLVLHRVLLVSVAAPPRQDTGFTREPAVTSRRRSK